MTEKKKYSHSKLSTFEQCRLRYKFRYIDKIIPEIRDTIEAHLGRTIHEAFEWLYTKVLDGKTPTIDELIVFYADKWQANFKEEIKIVKQDLNAKHYFEKGVKFLLNYYSRNFPFNDNTIDLEKEISLKLGEEEHELIGYIDRLVYNKQTGEYEIHDYKTSGSMPTKEKIENDRQLALYSLAIKEEFQTDKPICLNWHYLDFDKKICLKKTIEQLEKLKQEVINLINQIEETKDFPAKTSRLCDWCEYKPICPAFGNSFENPANEIKDTQNKIKFTKNPTLLEYIKEED